MISAVVLAAGRGERMGNLAKALLEVKGRTFLEHIARRCDALGITERWLVVGQPHRNAIIAAAPDTGFACVENPMPERGMASSVATGFAALSTGRAALLWPVDTPLVAVETLDSVVGLAAPARLVIPTFEGRGGHPVLVGSAFWQALVDCGGEKEGARSVFRHNQDAVLRLPVSDPFVLRDVDLPSDFDRLAESR